MARKKKDTRTWIGKLWDGFVGFVMGKKESFDKIETKTPEEKELKAIFMKAAERDAETYNPEKIPVSETPSIEELMPGGFPEIKQPEFEDVPRPDFTARRQLAERKFATEEVPALAEQFSATGGAIGLSSSSFAGSLGQARASLSAQLAGLEEEMHQKYNMRRAELQAAQQKASLLGQIAGAENRFKAGGFKMDRALNDWRRSDQLSTIQQRQRPDYQGIVGSPSFQTVYRPSTPGLLERGWKTGEKVGAAALKAYLTGGRG